MIKVVCDYCGQFIEESDPSKRYGVSLGHETEWLDICRHCDFRINGLVMTFKRGMMAAAEPALDRQKQ